MKDSVEDERRGRQRFLLKIPAELRTTEMSSDVQRGLYTRDISSQGAFLLTQNHLPEGEHVRLRFFLSIQALKDIVGEDRRITIDVGGRVIRSERKGLAVLFDPEYEMATVS